MSPPTTTADALFRHLNAEKDADPATKEALRYRDALLGAFASLSDRPLATRTAEEIWSRELVDVIFIQPYCRIGNLVDANRSEPYR